jgi:hypothetical protein
VKCVRGGSVAAYPSLALALDESGARFARPAAALFWDAEGCHLVDGLERLAADGFDLAGLASCPAIDPPLPAEWRRGLLMHAESPRVGSPPLDLVGGNEVDRVPSHAQPDARTRF